MNRSYHDTGRASRWGLGAFLLAICCTAYAAGRPELHVKHLTLEDGLSQTTITGIQQDHRGFMWFATRNGLNRYDGRRFKVYLPKHDKPNSLNHGGIWSLHLSQSGALWMGTQEGLSRFHGETETFTNYQPHGPGSGPGDNHVLAIAESHDGRLWIGTNGGGIRQFDPAKATFQSTPAAGDHLNDNVINALVEGSDGTLWVGTNSGLFTLSDGSIKAVASDRGPPQDPVDSVFQDSNQTIWVGTRTQGLYAYQPLTETFIQHRIEGDRPAGQVVSIFEDSNGILWFGTDGDGLLRYDRDQNNFTRYRSDRTRSSIAGDKIHAIYEDRTGLLWFGIYGSGIDRLGHYTFSGTTHSNDYPELTELNTRNIRTFYQDQNNTLWVGTLGGGLIRIERDTGQIKHSVQGDPGIEDNRIYRIYADRQDNIWIGQGNGWLSRYNSADDSFTSYRCNTQEHRGLTHSNIRAIFEDHAGTLWVGTDAGGLHTFDHDGQTLQPFPLDHLNQTPLLGSIINDIYQTTNNTTLWLATYGSGLLALDQTKTELRRYDTDLNNPNRMGSDYILSIREDSDGTFWLGSNGAGLIRFDPASGHSSNYTLDMGLPVNLVYGALQDNQGYIWLSHDNGLSKIDLDKERISNYDASDGLQANEFNGGAFYKNGNGELIFGGINGYNLFTPSALTTNPLSPPVVITNLSLFNQDVVAGEPIDDRILLPQSIVETTAVTLAHTDQVFSLEYAALDYLAPERNQYAYILEGFESQWNYVDTRNFATYTGLQPGQYTFRVKASNNNDVWNEQGTALEINVMPPYWQTWWFRILIALMVIALAFFSYSMRMRNVRLRNEKLERQVESRTAELEQQKDDLQNTLAELSDTKDALIQAAHDAGMTETTTGVLHNIGNILNSVNTSASMLQEALNQPVVKRFAKANEILRQNITNISEFIATNPKAKKLFEYYLELETSFHTENSRLLGSTARLVDQIDAIKEAVTAQQGYASGLEMSERADLHHVIEETLALQTGPISRYEVSITRQFADDIPAITVQKTRVVQILMNLVKNAIESMNQVADHANALTIRTYRDDKYACVEIIDSGAGIEQESLDRIFAYGFSTKRRGRGFGLHSCATYMKEMGGKIWAESDGPGHGARFCLAFHISESDLAQREQLSEPVTHCA